MTVIAPKLFWAINIQVRFVQVAFEINGNNGLRWEGIVSASNVKKKTRPIKHHMFR